MVAELELQHYQVKVGYLGFMNQYFICVQLIRSPAIDAEGPPTVVKIDQKGPFGPF